MKIVIPGGSGQIGSLLSRQFHTDGHEVVVLSRMPRDLPWRTIAWDARTLGAWSEEIDGADVVINLAGRSVNCRYSPENRRVIRDSRIDSTRIVGQAVAQAKRPPGVWLQASTATIYAHRYDAPNDEETGIVGRTEADVQDTWRFSTDVARSWEQTLDEAVTPDTRKVAMRSAMTMSPDRDGVFDRFLSLVRHGLGGSVGDGRQYVSWIHDQDFVRAIYYLIRQESLVGPVNLSAPNPLPYTEFIRAIGRAERVPWGIPATRWMLEIGALLLQTETELILKSRRVIPGRLLQEGFLFQFPCWSAAAGDLCQRWHEQRSELSNGVT